jgi:hypothetical protein
MLCLESCLLQHSCYIWLCFGRSGGDDQWCASSLYTIPSTPGELDKPTKAPAVPKKN